MLAGPVSVNQVVASAKAVCLHAVSHVFYDGAVKIFEQVDAGQEEHGVVDVNIVIHGNGVSKSYQVLFLAVWLNIIQLSQVRISQFVILMPVSQIIKTISQIDKWGTDKLLLLFYQEIVNMKKLTVPFMLALSVFSSNASADALGLYVGGGVWDHDPVGGFSTTNDVVNIDMESDLKYKEDSDSYAYIAFEHFIPLVPNVRVETASMGHAGTASGVTFNGKPGLTGDSLIDLDTTDAILYWRLLDNWVNLDLGLNARKLEADFGVDIETVSVSATIPMLYVNAQFDLPFTGLSIGADINMISYGDASYQDLRLRVLYEIGVIGFELGMKSTNLELKGLDNIEADLEFKGMMVGAFLHF